MKTCEFCGNEMLISAHGLCNGCRITLASLCWAGYPPAKKFMAKRGVTSTEQALAFMELERRLNELNH